METYLTAWRVFRTLSDENDKTADHLLTRHGWPARAGITMGDVACGDGRLLDRISIIGSRPIRKAVLIDPDEALLAEAEALIRSKNLVAEVEAHLGGAEEHFKTNAREA